MTSKTIELTITDEALMPSYAREGDAGADLRSAIDAVIVPGERMLIPTGIRLSLPDNLVALVHPRSGLALKNGITVLNAPGTIDSGYRGEIGVILHNASNDVFLVNRGDRIAQLVFQEFTTAKFKLVDSLDSTLRGDGGFGSTGVKAND